MAAVKLPITPLQVTRVGSRATCDPAPLDTDEDWLMLIRAEDFGLLVDSLLAEGWEVGGSLIAPDDSSLPAEERFSSFRRDDQNLLITASEQFHRRFLAASAFAKRMNLLSKSDRIALFQTVLYGNSCNAAFDHLPGVFADFPPAGFEVAA